MALLSWGATCTSTTAVEGDEPVRFVFRVSPGVSGPAWVQLNDALGHPGWVQVFHASGERVYLEERCDIEDCGAGGGVCGRAPSMVRRLGSDARVDYTWDGRESVFVAQSGCERREPAPEGDYVATFCWSLEAVDPGAGDPASGVIGRLGTVQCRDVPFRMPTDREVEFTLGEGADPDVASERSPA